MGLVIDSEIAKNTPCHGYKIDDELFLWSEGVVGMLSDPQEEIYCTTIITKEKIPKGLEKRWRFFKESAKLCSAKVQKYPKGSRLIPYLECMKEEASKKGIEI